ncbi:MAG: NAD-dependent epimerase/dehydratase family protein [Anaerolineae bacterium]|nr:NAD-dependent epimerase/dehydratase family protein [Anaerolineae bacterium]
MAKRILIIGGTRNMGYYLSQRLVAAGYDLTLLNRGITRDDLPPSIHRLHVDRSNHQQMRRALQGKRFDVAVDFVLYNGDETRTVIELFRDRIEHYIALSSGQVYLVREGLTRPFRESDYDGELMPAPEEISYAYEEWRYGMQKREVEDELLAEHARSGFPFTALRLPMVNSPRDPYNRLYNYYLRLRDGGPILAPDEPNYVLNHVDGQDVVKAIADLIDSGAGKGKAYNIAQDEHISHADFLMALAEIMGAEARTVTANRGDLVANGFLPDCAPFSERWMSALDNRRSKVELGLSYTPLAESLKGLVEYYDAQLLPQPLTYRRRRAELQYAKGLALQPGS